MEKEIEEIIKKNLPSHVGDILRSRLEQAANDESKVKTQADELLAKQYSIDRLQEELKSYYKFDERNSKLTERENAVSEAERNLKIKELEFKLSSEKEKTDFTKAVAMGLVRNIEYRNHTFNNENPAAYYDATGRYIVPGTSSNSSTETKEAT